MILKPFPPPTPKKKPLSITDPVLKYVSKVKAEVPKLMPGERVKVLDAEPNSRELLLEPAEDAVSAKAIVL